MTPLCKSAILVVLLHFFTAVSVLIRAPSVFRSDEADMHKYSAILAATEPFRIQCEEQIKRSANPIKFLAKRILGKTPLEVGDEEREENAAIDVALTRFEVRVQNTLTSYGMTLDEFNQLSETVGKESVLKKRILLQSYLYKMAADLEFNLRKAMPVLPPIGGRDSIVKVPFMALPVPTSSSSSTGKEGILEIDDTPEITRFARALSMIEAERIKIRDSIKRELHIRELPPRMADPEYLPAMCPTIQKACKDFPNLASFIIRRNGLHVEEFNTLQEKLTKNVVYRFQVQREIEKLEKKGEY